MKPEFDFQVVSLSPFIERIRNFKSDYPEALPQRSNVGLRDSRRPSRDDNRILYCELQCLLVR